MKTSCSVLSRGVLVTAALLVFTGCSNSYLDFGYSDMEAPHLNGRGLLLMKKNEKNENKIVSDTIFLQRRVIKNYFVGVGLPAEIITFSCVGGVEGFNYKVNSALNFVVINMATDERKDSVSFEGLSSYLSSKDIKIKPFNRGRVTEYKKWIESSIMVNQKLNKNCKRG